MGCFHAKTLTWIPSKSIKGTKNLDSSLVSNKNLSEIPPSTSWAQSQETLDKMTKNYPTYDINHKKKRTQNQENFNSL